MRQFWAVTLVLWGMIVLPAPALSVEKAEVEQWGYELSVSTGERMPTFAVRLGKPERLVLQSPLVTLIGRYGANADLFVRRGEEWVRVSWREPKEHEVAAGDLGDLQTEERVAAADMPEWYKKLPRDVADGVHSFFKFRTGNAYIILLRDQSESAARRLAAAINDTWL